MASQESKTTETYINEAVDELLESMVAKAAEDARNEDSVRTDPVDDLPLVEEQTPPEAAAVAAPQNYGQGRERQVHDLDDKDGPSEQNDKQEQEQADELITKPRDEVVSQSDAMTMATDETVLIPDAPEVISGPAPHVIALEAPMWMVESFLASHVARWKAHQEAETVNSILHWLALGGTGLGLAQFCNDTRCSGLRAARHWQGAYRRCLAALSTSPPGEPSQQDILTLCIEAEQRTWMGSFRPGTRLLDAAAKLDLTRLGGNFAGVFANDNVFGDSEEAPKAAAKKVVDRPLALTHEELVQKIQNAVTLSNELQQRRLGSMRDAVMSSTVHQNDADELNALHLKGVERLARAIAVDEGRRVAPGGANSVEFTPSLHIDPSYGESPASALRFKSPYAAQAAELLVKKLFTRDGALNAPSGQHGSSDDGNAAAFPLMAPDLSGMLSSLDRDPADGLAAERMLPSSICKVPTSPESLRTYASDAIVRAWSTEFTPLPLRAWGEIGEAQDASASDKWAEALRGGPDDGDRESQLQTEISTQVPTWDLLPEFVIKLDRTEEQQEAIARHRAEKWLQTGGEMPPMQRMRRIRQLADRFRSLYGHRNVRLPVEIVAMELPYGTAETFAQRKMTQSTRCWIDSLRGHLTMSLSRGAPKGMMDFSGPGSVQTLPAEVIAEDILTEAQRAVWERRMQRWPGGEMPADLKVERMTSLATRFREKYQQQQQPSTRDGCTTANRYQRVACWPPWPIYTASYGAFYPSLQWIGLRPGSGTVDIEASEADAMLEDLLVEITMAKAGKDQQLQQGAREGLSSEAVGHPQSEATAEEAESDSVLDVLLADMEADEEKDKSSHSGLNWKQEVRFCHRALYVWVVPLDLLGPVDAASCPL